MYSVNEFLDTTDILEYQLDYIGKPLNTKITYTRNGVTLTTLDFYMYDHVGRLLPQTQGIVNEERSNLPLIKTPYCLQNLI